ncbi:unnamed protein product, partial [Ectocarpus sp. 8 AP-2014]
EAVHNRGRAGAPCRKERDDGLPQHGPETPPLPHPLHLPRSRRRRDKVLFLRPAEERPPHPLHWQRDKQRGVREVRVHQPDAQARA